MISDMVFLIKRSHLYRNLGVALIMLVAGIVAIIETAPDGALASIPAPDMVNTVGWISSLVFGFYALVVIRRLGLPNQGLIITPEGFVDRISGDYQLEAKWQDVADVAEFTEGNKPFIAVHLLHPQNFIDQQPPMERMVLKSNMKHRGAPIVIATSSLNASHGEVFNYMLGYYQGFGPNASPIEESE